MKGKSVNIESEEPKKLSEQRRRELADFLRTRREKLKPEQVGIAHASRRRTPGLRREEVAEIAGVGTTWYTWLEQARDIQPSSDVLRRLGQALQMTPAEIRHLYSLAGKAAPADAESFSEALPPSLSRILHHALQVPVMAFGRRWDILDANEHFYNMISWIRNYVQAGKEKANWVYIIFCAPEARTTFGDWEMNSRRLLAEFRASLSDTLEDPWALEMIERLKADSIEFNQWWREHDVRDKSVAHLEVRDNGVISLYERSILRTPENPRVRLLLFTSAEVEKPTV
jgi:transcriptional regulator with XRE-family HTH domain